MLTSLPGYGNWQGMTGSSVWSTRASRPIPPRAVRKCFGCLHENRTGTNVLLIFPTAAFLTERSFAAGGAATGATNTGMAVGTGDPQTTTTVRARTSETNTTATTAATITIPANS